MASSFRLMSGAVAIALSLVSGLAHATWHVIEEGEFYPDFDDPNAPDVFNIYPAEIYDPTDYFAGNVGTAGDTSDTLMLRMGPDDYPYYRLTEFRVTMVGPWPPSGGEVLKVVLTAVEPGIPLLSIDLTADPSGRSYYVSSNLNLAYHLYSLSLSTAGLNPQQSGGVGYGIGFTIQTIPEPAQWAMVLAGLAGIAGVQYGKRGRSNLSPRKPRHSRRRGKAAGAGAPAANPQSQQANSGCPHCK